MRAGRKQAIACAVSVAVGALLGAHILQRNDGARVPNAHQDAAPRVRRRAAFQVPLARSEYAVLVRPTTKDIDATFDRGALAARLDVPQCGTACDAVRKLVNDELAFQLERTTVDDYMLPPEDTWDVVAKTLSPDERKTLHERSVVLVVRARESDGQRSTRHLVARAAIAVASLLATTLDGIVYDETLRRFEPARDLAARTIRVSPEASAFSPSQIVIQSYVDEDGRARLLTLGMGRFGAPDLSVRGVAPSTVDAAANLLNAAAAVMAGGATSLPISVPRADGVLLELDGFSPAHTAGDPDNVMIELMPPEGGWDGVLAAFTRAGARVVHADQDDALLGIARRARDTLPSARAAVARDAGTLFVKGPFAYDGGSEWMWIEARRCDARVCVGALTNDPSSATSLRRGAEAEVRNEDLADWLLVLPDGGSVGGASIQELERR